MKVVSTCAKELIVKKRKINPHPTFLIDNKPIGYFELWCRKKKKRSTGIDETLLIAVGRELLVKALCALAI